MPPEVRFWTKVTKTDTCWLWTGARQPNGYGVFHWGSRNGRMMAHYFLAGPPPEGCVWDHLCRMRHCVRPDHLAAITQSENARRASRTFNYAQRFPVEKRATPSVEERFWAKVNKTDTCWMWTGGTARGYGKFSVDGTLIHAHHFLMGKPPPGMVTDHLCRNRLCVRPDHLEFVSGAENLRRAPRLGPKPGTHCAKGHPFTQGTTQQICRVCKRESVKRRMADPEKRAARRASERARRARLRAVKPAKTHCAKGHPWTSENIGLQAGGKSKYCIPCRRESSRAYYLAHR